MFGNTVLLSASHEWLRGFIPNPEETLMRSLLWNYLFEKSIVVPDEDFYMNTQLMDMIKNEDSLFSNCVKDGVVVPCFRERGVVSYVDSYNLLYSPKYHIGPLKGGNQDTAGTLDHYSKGKDINPRYWPHIDEVCVAVEYERLVWKYLLPNNETVDGMDPAVKAKFDLTREFREELLPEAKKRTEKGGWDGLRLWQWFDALKDSLCIDNDAVVNFEGLIPLIDDPHKKRAAHILGWWLSELYRYNQAKCFGITPNFPGYDAPSAPSASLVEGKRPKGIRDKRSKISKTGTQVISSSHELRIIVPFPRPDVLLSMPPKELSKARFTWLPALHEALAKWQESSINESQQDIVKALEGYAETLIGVCTDNPGRSRLEAFISPGSSFFKGFVLGSASNFAYDIAKDIVGWPDWPFSGLQLVSGAAAVGYEQSRKWRRRQPKALTWNIPNYNHSESDDADAIVTQLLLTRSLPFIPGEVVSGNKRLA